MKVILSRKGFDETAGGMASPILPDGTLLSLPIPDTTGRAYTDLHYGKYTYNDILTQLKPNFAHMYCHHDPDIRWGIFDAPAEWKAVFGQDSGSLTHLKNQNVGIDDLFLFYGWFRRTEYIDGKLRYVPNEPDLHIIYGYLQVGAILENKEDIKKYSWHPHADYGDKNCMYVARDTLSWNSNPGYGVFSYIKRFVLTKDSMSRSCWNLPAFFEKLKITGAGTNAWKTDPQGNRYCQIANTPGQEFVIEENNEVTAWAKSLIDG